jgi:plasmid stability protein
MGEIVIRNLDDSVIEAFRRRAAASGTSIEDEARRALAAAVRMDPVATAQRVAEVRQLIGRLAGQPTLECSGDERARTVD